MATKEGQHKGKPFGTKSNYGGTTKRKFKRMNAKNGGSTKATHQGRV